MHICAGYLEPLFVRERRKEIIQKSCKMVEHVSTKVDFYAIAVTGTSGILGAIVANELGLDLITVRGRESKAHSTRSAEGVFKEGGYIFFDDLIDSGETVVRVRNSIIAQCAEGQWDYSVTPYRHDIPDTPELVGAVLYDCSSTYYVKDYRANYMSYVYSAQLPNELPVWPVRMRLP